MRFINSRYNNLNNGLQGGLEEAKASGRKANRNASVRLSNTRKGNALNYHS